MKPRILFSLILCLVLLITATGPAQAQGPETQATMGTAFTYEGQLKQSGTPVDGTCDFQFTLWNAPAGGAQVGTALTQTSVAVTNGLFTVPLDFGASPFQGVARYLEPSVRCPAGSGVYTTLSPRQALTPTPYALYAATAGAGAFWALAGNAGTTAGTNFVGTTDNQALVFKVNGARALRLEPDATSPNLIGGYSGNAVTAGASGATIGGGGASGYLNRVTDSYGVVAGGFNNQAGNNAGTTIDAGTATVGGGDHNTASEQHATVGGGRDNIASGVGATVGGGYGSTASGQFATVPGGAFNEAQGDFSFAAGRRAKANNFGCFAWADSTDADFACNTANQFAVRAGGGVRLMTAGAGATIDGNTVWNAGNDGTGSTLDADLLDAHDAGFFQQRVTGTCASGSAIRVVKADGTVTCQSISASFWSLTGNAGTTAGTNFVGTSDNQALVFKVNGARALRLEPNASSPNLIGGYSGNAVTAGAFGATIAGGGESGYLNRVTDSYGVVGGGYSNQAGNDANTTIDAGAATVGGGYLNTASGAFATVGGGRLNTAIGGFATVGGGDSNTASGVGATVGGGDSNTASANLGTVGGGQTNSASGWGATVGGGWGNIASGGSATVPGGGVNTAQGEYSFAAGHGAKANSAGCFVWADNTNGDFACNTTNLFAVRATGGLSLTVDTGGGGLRVQPNATSPNIIGGYSGNTVTAGAYGATIAGGGAGEGYSNLVTGNFGTVAGGFRNVAGGMSATVGGGFNNTTSNWYATVGGGVWNIATGRYATVGGGADNTASGSNSTVPGGVYNWAKADFSFAAGRRAKANNQGCFVWGDATDSDVTCNSTNRFVVRASGGVYLYSNAALTTGVYLAPGASTWTGIVSPSDQNAKENFAPVSGKDVLERLSKVPITSWNYKADTPVRHIGPMTQDFTAAFGVGEDDLSIPTIDANGVALAGVQALYQMVQEKDAQIADLEARVVALEALVAQLAQK